MPNSNNVLFASNEEFTQQLVHDIKAPLLVLKHSLKNDEFLHSAVMRIEAIIAEAKNLSNVNSTTIQRDSSSFLKPDKQSVCEILEEIIKEKRCLINVDQRSKTRMVFDACNDDRMICAPGSTSYLKRCFSNVLDNAIESRARNTGLEVVIKMRIYESTIMIEITDNGVGIPKEMISNLGKHPMTFGKVGGSGRGTYFTKRFLNSIDGDIQFERRASSGTKAQITIPVLH